MAKEKSIHPRFDSLGRLVFGSRDAFVAVVLNAAIASAAAAGPMANHPGPADVKPSLPRQNAEAAKPTEPTIRPERPDSQHALDMQAWLKQARPTGEYKINSLCGC